MDQEGSRYDDLLSSEVCREELQQCKGRHPDLNDALARLQALLQQGVCRELQVTADKRALQIAVFGLAHQAADDFFDVVLLATHGYGIGAQKLLRLLYERIVSALYLIDHPDEVQDFNEYIDIDTWHVIANAKLYGACGFWPTMLLHTTGVSLEARLTPTATGGRAFKHEPTRNDADAALKCAHDLIALLLHKCNEFFGWGLDATPLAQDVMRCWGAGTGR